MHRKKMMWFFFVLQLLLPEIRAFIFDTKATMTKRSNCATMKGQRIERLSPDLDVFHQKWACNVTLVSYLQFHFFWILSDILSNIGQKANKFHKSQLVGHTCKLCIRYGHWRDKKLAERKTFMATLVVGCGLWTVHYFIPCVPWSASLGFPRAS